jgi:hypothetical protein
MCCLLAQAKPYTPIWKITKAKKAGGVARVVKRLTARPKALRSDPNKPRKRVKCQEKKKSTVVFCKNSTCSLCVCVFPGILKLQKADREVHMFH